MRGDGDFALASTDVTLSSSIKRTSGMDGNMEEWGWLPPEGGKGPPWPEVLSSDWLRHGRGGAGGEAISGGGGIPPGVRRELESPDRELH